MRFIRIALSRKILASIDTFTQSKGSFEMVEMANFGDKQINQKHELHQHSEINLLSVGDGYSPEAKAQKMFGDRIAKVQDTIMSTIDKLAAYYPNGYQGVLDSMTPGPAYDHLASIIKASQTDIA
jgi:hypothetical protein